MEDNIQRLLDANAAGSPIMGRPDEPRQFTLEPISTDQVRQVQGDGIPVLTVTKLYASRYSVRILDPFRTKSSVPGAASEKLIETLKMMGIDRLFRLGAIPGFVDPKPGPAAGASSLHRTIDAANVLIWPKAADFPDIVSGLTAAEDKSLSVDEQSGEEDDVDQAPSAFKPI